MPADDSAAPASTRLSDAYGPSAFSSVFRRCVNMDRTMASNALASAMVTAGGRKRN
jgi:hypothetical protein